MADFIVNIWKVAELRGATGDISRGPHPGGVNWAIPISETLFCVGDGTRAIFYETRLRANISACDCLTCARAAPMLFVDKNVILRPSAPLDYSRAQFPEWEQMQADRLGVPRNGGNGEITNDFLKRAVKS